MKKNLKKISTIVIMLIFVLVSTNALTPPKAHAQLSVVTDFLTEIWGGITSAATTVGAAAQTALGVKEFSIKPIAVAILKIMLKQLTMSIVNWINTGFQGSPSFVTNPASFFENIGDQLAGRFLMADGDLRFLCSPFSLDVRLALTIKMQGGAGDPYACTLTGAIKNATNAVNNFTITGFIQGDFRQGGWPAFVSLTTVPANSPNGAFLKAKNDLEVKISSTVTQKTNELLQGAGFLSSEQCDYTAVDPSSGFTVPISKDEYGAADKNDPGAAYTGTIRKENCVTTTPGSVISGTLQKALNVPTDELLLAQDIDAIIGAAFSQLAFMVLKTGLSALSGNSATSAGSNYFKQIEGESAASLKTSQTQIAKSIVPFIATEQSLKATADTSLALGTTLNNTANSVQACYTAAISTASTSSQYQQGVAFAQAQLAAIQRVISSTTAPLMQSLLNDDYTKTTNLQSLTNLQTSIQTATTTDALNAAAQVLTDISANGQLPIASDVQIAKNALNDLHDTVDPIQSRANTWLQQCRSFDVRTFPNSVTEAPATIR